MAEAEGKKAIWLITYCDLYTLILVAFILVVALTYQAPEKKFQEENAVWSGPGGVAGPNRKIDRATVVWRVIPPSGRLDAAGSEMPPLWSEPAAKRTEHVLQRLETARLGTLADSYALRLPLELLFDEDGKLAPSGSQLLEIVGRNIRPLPYDVFVQVGDLGSASRAVSVCDFLARKERILPRRLAVGVRPPALPGNDNEIVLTFVRRSS